MTGCGENDFYDDVTGKCTQCQVICFAPNVIERDRCSQLCQMFLSKQNKTEPLSSTQKPHYTEHYPNNIFNKSTTLEDKTLYLALIITLVLCILCALIAFIWICNFWRRRKEVRSRSTSQKSEEVVETDDKEDSSNKPESGFLRKYLKCGAKRHHDSGDSSASSTKLLSKKSNIDQTWFVHPAVMEQTEEKNPPASVRLADMCRKEGIEYEPNEKPAKQETMFQDKKCSLREGDDGGRTGRIGIGGAAYEPIGEFYEETNRKLVETSIVVPNNFNHDSGAEIEPRMTDLVDWMLTVDWIGEYIPSINQLRVGVDLSKMEEREAKSLIESEMSKCRVKLDLIIFPSSGGLYVPSMFPNPFHHKTAGEADPIEISSSEDEATVESRSSSCESCKYPVECTDGTSSGEELTEQNFVKRSEENETGASSNLSVREPLFLGADKDTWKINANAGIDSSDVSDRVPLHREADQYHLNENRRMDGISNSSNRVPLHFGAGQWSLTENRRMGGPSNISSVKPLYLGADQRHLSDARRISGISNIPSDEPLQLVAHQRLWSQNRSVEGIANKSTDESFGLSSYLHPTSRIKKTDGNSNAFSNNSFDVGANQLPLSMCRTQEADSLFSSTVDRRGLCQRDKHLELNHQTPRLRSDLSNHYATASDMQTEQGYASGSSDSLLNTKMNLVEDKIKLLPGMQLYSNEMEMEDKERTKGGVGISGGCICDMDTNRVYGLTVGHLFQHEGLQCQLTNSHGQIVGTCLHKIDTVQVNGSKIHADLTLIDLQANVQPLNTVTINGCKYNLCLYTGDIDNIKNEKVMMVNRDGIIKHGVIDQTALNVKFDGGQNILNAISVIKEVSSDNYEKINEKGDSGSLLLSCPKSVYQEGDKLMVYGMVTGYYNRFQDKPLPSRTIACRLYEVLKVYLNTDKIQFITQNLEGSTPTPLDDSAYYSNDGSMNTSNMSMDL